MSLRHTTTVWMSEADFVDSGLRRWMTVVGPVGRALRGKGPRETDPGFSDWMGGDDLAEAGYRLAHALELASRIGKGSIELPLNAPACDALAVVLTRIKDEDNLTDATREVIDKLLLRVNWAKVELERSNEAWAYAEDMQQETVYFSGFEETEVAHWMGIMEAEIENGRREALADAERLVDIRMHDQYSQAPAGRSFTGDSETFRWLRDVIGEGYEVAQDWERTTSEFAVPRYELLLKKIDDTIERLDDLESDEYLRATARVGSEVLANQN